MLWDTDAQEKPFPDVVAALLTEAEVPLQLLYRLSDMHPDDFVHLAANWPQATDERRRIITRHLADISEENFVVDFAPFFKFCLGDPHPAVRLAALDGMWDTTNTECIAPILQLLHQDPEEAVRAAAAGALTHFVLMAEWGELPRHIAPPIVEALLAIYEEPETAVSVKRAALEALGAASHPRVAKLIESAYTSGIYELQLSAVFAMGSSADERWRPTLVDEMESPYPAMRAEAARAAGSVGGSDLVAPLAELILDEERDVALAAISALGQVGGERVYDILLQLVDDPDFTHVREAIETAMEEIDWLGGDFGLLLSSRDASLRDDLDEPDWDAEDDF